MRKSPNKFDQNFGEFFSFVFLQKVTSSFDRVVILTITARNLFLKENQNKTREKLSSTTVSQT
jgi:hypothetical protein